MDQSRRLFVAGAVAAGVGFPICESVAGEKTMYGLIGKFTAVEGQRDRLISILLDGVSGMPGCLSYVIARDPDDADAIWITEVWDSEASHKAALQMPSVQEAIAKGRPLIAGMTPVASTQPVGGFGLPHTD